MNQKLVMRATILTGIAFAFALESCVTLTTQNYYPESQSAKPALASAQQTTAQQTGGCGCAGVAYAGQYPQQPGMPQYAYYPPNNYPQGYGGYSGGYYPQPNVPYYPPVYQGNPGGGYYPQPTIVYVPQGYSYPSGSTSAPGDVGSGGQQGDVVITDLPSNGAGGWAAGSNAGGVAAGRVRNEPLPSDDPATTTNVKAEPLGDPNARTAAGSFERNVERQHVQSDVPVIAPSAGGAHVASTPHSRVEQFRPHDSLAAAGGVSATATVPVKEISTVSPAKRNRGTSEVQPVGESSSSVSTTAVRATAVQETHKTTPVNVSVTSIPTATGTATPHKAEAATATKKSGAVSVTQVKSVASESVKKTEANVKKTEAKAASTATATVSENESAVGTPVSVPAARAHGEDPR